MFIYAGPASFLCDVYFCQVSCLMPRRCLSWHWFGGVGSSSGKNPVMYLEQSSIAPSLCTSSQRPLEFLKTGR